MDWGRVREAPSANLVAAMSKVLGASSRGGLGVVIPNFLLEIVKQSVSQRVWVAQEVSKKSVVTFVMCESSWSV